MTFSREELKRYSRQILVPEIALAGQGRLKSSSVLVIGAGGLGSPVLNYLVAAGIGRVGISEFDTLELHNLQRQTLYSSEQVGRPKLEAALERLRTVNPEVQLEGFPKLTPENASEMFSSFDLIVDASDNFGTRYLISDTCVALEKPWVWGAAQGLEGMVSVFNSELSLRDAFPNPPETQDDCDTLGVLGPMLAVIGGLMASEAIKHLVGLETLYGKLWTFDALSSQVRLLKLKTQNSRTV
jgi:molybdopterin-synthase adenylyltransferase